ncbi:MAG TPA: uracil-DNA glycosylase [Anaerolineaceae bacterium]|nr:uracil-DNA glycosylase [Anaerolineaceae bacterium]
MNTAEILQEIAAQVAACQACSLHHSRKNAVPGEGSPVSEIMFIGEGPGFHENEQGRPFVGQAGKFLDELLKEAGYEREQVFIANVVKCRPPGNRDPLPDELTACARYLDRQIEAINPCVIVTLGRVSMGKFLPNARISEVHGKTFWVHDRLIVPMYHPAAALHQPSLKPTLIEDFKTLPAAIASARAAGRNLVEQEPSVQTESKKVEENPEQLSLF